MPDATFWLGKRVLVTGHTGFKGSWLSMWLNAMGAEVYGYALAPSTTPNLHDLAGLADHTDSTIADINDAAALSRHMAAVKPEVVFHLAAQALVRESFQAPVNTIQTNVIGTLNVLEAIRQCPEVKAAVMVTSDKCYQNNEWLWGYRENEALGGHDPYSASKACAELLVQAWRLSFMQPGGTAHQRCAMASARAGNVIGGGDWSAGRLVPDVLDCATQAKTIVLRYPNAIRPWQHVLEPLAGYLMLAEKLTQEGHTWAEAWNFGPHERDARPVSTLVETLLQRLNSDSQWVVEAEAQPHEAQQLKLDCAKANQMLGWSPVWTLDDALGEIATWHQAYLQQDDMHRVSLETIQRYVNAIDNQTPA